MNICMKEFIILVELRQLFPYMAFVYAWIVPLWANQLLPQLTLTVGGVSNKHCLLTFFIRSGTSLKFKGDI